MYVGRAVDNSDRAPALIAQIEDATARLATGQTREDRRA